MKLCVAYTAVCNGPITSDYCARFAATWNEYPPGIETDLIVICNGGPLSTEQAMIFAALNAKMLVRSNEGWDIGGYCQAARSCCANYDAVLWAGESNYFHREGWLRRFAEVWQRHGAGFYGPYSSNAIRAHLNTTAFFCSPQILRSYPKHISTRADRYEAEHGEHAMWRRAAARGLPVRLVTWDGEWEPERWRSPRNILWRGDQSNCLLHCNHSDAYDNANPRIKAQWAARSDAPFR